jgi:hypothetical protein
MAKGKLSEREMDYKLAKLGHVCKSVTRILTTAIKYGCVLGMGYFFFDAVKHFVGEETSANILVQLIADLKINQWLGYVVGGGGVIYGGVRTNQLKQTRKKHAEHIKQLELLIDPKRQSSRLNLFGDTHEDDR